MGRTIPPTRQRRFGPWNFIREDNTEMWNRGPGKKNPFGTSEEGTNNRKIKKSLPYPEATTTTPNRPSTCCVGLGFGVVNYLSQSPSLYEGGTSVEASKQIENNKRIRGPSGKWREASEGELAGGPERRSLFREECKKKKIS